jgi:AcrR family transcriptional regulator
MSSTSPSADHPSGRLAAIDGDADTAARRARAASRSTQLLNATARLMERDGSQAVSMQAIAEEAGVSVGLIYRYFGGKEELLLAVITHVLDIFATQIPAASTLPATTPSSGWPRRSAPSAG